ncbi:NADH:ubiquinone reductase (Na(+)-transporting) subunit B [Desulfogranum japonicum]|uniref:NADH:ubiquinone reductase (Na(+)-transporting) subunit B n=1 Tax=Desulfogranum japonicum TaxID=231447 RepID=UPI0003F7F79F|nr:NADH:ubiquinone reductase (Na(+)-transporting) subunit B [Desulfogranum japonicum]
MKILSNLLEKFGSRFTKGGPLERWYPFYEAIDSFLFHSSRTTKTAPHIRDAVDYKRIMITVLIALIPCTFMALWNTGYQANLGLQQMGISSPEGWRGVIMEWAGGCDAQSLFSNCIHGALYFLPIYLVTLVVGSIWESLFNIIRGHEFSEAFLVTSLLFPLTLPPTVPLWQVALGISFGIVFAKEVFGGVGRNFMNPALVSRAFLFFAYPAQLTGDKVWTAVDGFTGATPISAAAGGIVQQGTESAGYGFWQLFLGNIPGSMGETSTLACLLGVAILLVAGIASWRIMLSMFLGGIVMASVLFVLPSGSNPLLEIPPHYHMVMGGFAFGLTFMATDPVSASQTQVGQWLYGAFIGIMAILIRVLNPAYPEGVMLAILLGNVLAPLLDYCVIQAHIQRRAVRHG